MVSYTKVVIPYTSRGCMISHFKISLLWVVKMDLLYGDKLQTHGKT